MMQNKEKQAVFLNRLSAVTLSVLWLVWAAACGPGDSTGSGGGIGGSGIQDADVAIGRLTGFGSVFINGQKFTTDNAVIVTNGVVAAQANLRIGMTVQAEVDFEQQAAYRIEYIPQLVGPVDSIDLTANSFEIFGQTIQLNDSVIYEGLSLEDIAPGVVLEVSGLRNAAGSVAGSFIRQANNERGFLVQGLAGSGGQSIAIAGIPGFFEDIFIDFNVPVVDSQTVLLSIPSFNGAPSLTGRVVYAAPPIRYTAGRQAQVTDFVSSTVADGRFSLGRLSIVSNADTVIRYVDGSVAGISDVELDSLVEITGRVTTDARATVIADSIVILL